MGFYWHMYPPAMIGPRTRFWPISLSLGDNKWLSSPGLVV
jgi:hypothetical protein